MIIKNAQAGLILKNVVVVDLAIKNCLVEGFKFDENSQILDVDYNTLNVRSDEKTYFTEIEMKTRITIKKNRKIYFDLKITHLAFYAASKKQYQTPGEFSDAVNLNGLASLISFARSNISSITGLTFCQGNITLPMLNVFKLNELKAKSQQPNKVGE